MNRPVTMNPAMDEPKPHPAPPVDGVTPASAHAASTAPPAPWVDRDPCCIRRETCLTVRDLTVCYDGKPALRGVNLPICRHCITAVIGPSGCGKSTFLAALNRMTDLIPGCTATGSITLDDQQILDPAVNPVALRRRVGMIFQKPNPFPLSILANLTFPLKQHGMKKRAHRADAAEATLRQVGLWDEVKDRLHAPASGLSGGQQQRLCLARALALQPEVILLDEPCSALDPMAGGVVEDLIASLRGRYTVVVVTHNLAQARRIADDVAMFWLHDHAGALIEHAPAAQLFENPRHPTTTAYLRGERG